MNVSLTQELDRFIAEKLEEGTFASQSEIVRAGLRLLIERDRLLEARLDPDGVGLEAATAASVPPEPAVAEEGGPSEGRTGLPAFLWPHFPEHDPARLSLETDRATIVGRLLGVPHMEAVRWLRTHVPASELRDFLARRRGAGLDPKSLRFWGLLLDLPRDAVDRWVKAARETTWKRRTSP